MTINGNLEFTYSGLNPGLTQTEKDQIAAGKATNLITYPHAAPAAVEPDPEPDPAAVEPDPEPDAPAPAPPPAPAPVGKKKGR